MRASTPITTATAWTEKRKFEEPTLSDVMTTVRGKGAKLRVLALDAYVGQIPWSDLAQFQPILATTQGGVRLSSRCCSSLTEMFRSRARPGVEPRAHW